ncbi:MAG: hypothetical protein LBJ10_10055 [Clostridiales bacterium]|jgi:hypothetical protein|nr:hypothetical protein [Clostridiales bacterium]
MAKPQAFSSFAFARCLRPEKAAQLPYPFDPLKNTVALIGFGGGIFRKH